VAVCRRQHTLRRRPTRASRLQFAAAVKRVAEGGTAIDPSVVSQLLGRSRRNDPLAALTPREREVLALMAAGLSNLAIAERIVVTP